MWANIAEINQSADAAFQGILQLIAALPGIVETPVQQGILDSVALAQTRNDQIDAMIADFKAQFLK